MGAQYSARLWAPAWWDRPYRARDPGVVGHLTLAVGPVAGPSRRALSFVIVGARARPFRRVWLGDLAAGLSLLAAGCDPIVSIEGSYFPAWIVCMAAGIVVTALLRQLFVAIRVEPHLGPLLLIYPSLWIAATLVLWLALYRT